MNHFPLRRTIALLSLAPFSALATNGMNLEGYGPIALGMGGTSFAFDNGTAAVINPCSKGDIGKSRSSDGLATAITPSS